MTIFKKSLIGLGFAAVGIFIAIFISIFSIMNTSYYERNERILTEAARSFQEDAGYNRLAWYFAVPIPEGGGQIPFTAGLSPENEFTYAGEDKAFRLTLIDSDGEVRWDSHVKENMPNHIDRPEVAVAIYEGQLGTATRISASTGVRQMYSALPVFSGGKVVGVFRLSNNIVSFQQRLYQALPLFIVLLTLIIALVIAAVMFMSPAKLKKIRKTLLHFLINIGTSGKYMGEKAFGMSDHLIRYVLMNFIIIAGSIVLALFIVTDYRQGHYFTVAACSGMVLSCLVTFVLARTKIRQFIPALILMISYGIMCILITWTGESEGANFLFIYIYPLLTIMLLGMNYGVTLSIILIVFVSAEMFTSGFSRYHYNFDFSIRMLVNYLMALAVMFVIEITRTTKDRMIESQNKKLQQLKDEAEAANHSKSSFLATMSHEIRTPMNSIIGVAQIQLQKENLPDEYSSALEKIHNSGNSLLGIINDILDMSKIETGRLELVPIDYDIPSLVNDAVQLNIVRIGSKPLEFVLDIDENLPSRFFGDELRIKQILNNLLSNAIKYTEKGQVKLSVNHEKRETDMILRLIVEDSGQGMRPEDLEKLFSEYSRFNTEANRATEGTGLGLNITRKLVAMMDGTINVKSEYGKGSVFTVEIKQKAVECGVIGPDLAKKLREFKFTSEKRSALPQITRYLMPYGKVLIVDDVDTNLYVAEGLMSPYKMSIETASSGITAINKVESGKKYDIIFMDHMMPLMDGIEATQKLRAMGYDGVIVALTANALTGNDEMFLKNGFDGFISKPIDLRHLNAVLNKFVRNRHPEEAEKFKTIGSDREQPNNELEPAETGLPSPNPRLLEVFRRDAEKAIKTLRETAASGDIKLYTTTAHAMKSALANIGENEKSATAAALEKAGQNEDREFIAFNTEAFIETLEALVAKLSPEEPAPVQDDPDLAEDLSFLAEQLQIMKTACENYDDTAAYAALDKLKEKQWKAKTNAALAGIRDILFLHSDFDEAVEKIRILLEGNNGQD